ncbi:MAG: AAA family ATPase [Lachnospiraceae bacterium]|nr:AAA family ATPase [Lachnospiraceae bacterium]
MKKFNITGLCIPSKHYMVDLSEKVNLILDNYISQGAYFTINRARQFGKTTIINALETRLCKEYLVISISLEAADDYFASMQTFVNGLVMDIADELRRNNVAESIISEWETRIEGDYPLKMFGRKVSSLCAQSKKEVVLIIDEADQSSDNQIFLSFLGMLRDKYLKREMDRDTTFRSVILAGVYNVKNLKLKIRPDEEKKYNSPWNIAIDFQVDMSFSKTDISQMLHNYSKDTGITMDENAISEKIHFYTNGYPMLVSWLCKWIDENGGREWTIQNVENAEKELLKSDNTLFDDMIKNVENNKGFRKVITGLLLDGFHLPFVKSDSEINLGVMFGILAEKDNETVISNIVFETFLYNHLISSQLQARYLFGFEKNQFIENGQLNMEQALQKFQEIMKAEYRKEDAAFLEQQGRLLFLCFMKPIINGKGSYYVEPETRNNTRMDIVIAYGGNEYIIELKIWHGQQYRQNGLNQLCDYLESRNSSKGYLISFNFNENKEYVQNTIIGKDVTKEIYEIVV